MAAPQYVYVMKGLSKTYPGGKQVLKNIWLPFFPAPRSACSASTARANRRCCASWPGVDKEFTGEAWAAEGVRVGYLPQEPELDPTQGRAGNVMEGVAGEQALLDRFNEISP